MTHLTILSGEEWPLDVPRSYELPAAVCVGDDVFLTLRSDVAIHKILMKVTYKVHHIVGDEPTMSMARCVVTYHCAMEIDPLRGDHAVPQTETFLPPTGPDRGRAVLKLVD